MLGAHVLSSQFDRQMHLNKTICHSHSKRDFNIFKRSLFFWLLADFFRLQTAQISNTLKVGSLRYDALQIHMVFFLLKH